MIKKLKNLMLLVLLLSSITLSAQTAETELVNWINKDLKTDQVFGVSTDKAYEFLKPKKSKTVIVAVLDSGIDIEHEDLKDNIWVNEDEIPGNGIDDDGNGYIDDVHGWNFLGNAKGENIVHETLELTRLYRKYSAIYKDKKPAEIPADKKDEYNYYLKIKNEFETESQEIMQEYLGIQNFLKNYRLIDQLLVNHLKKEDYTLEDLEKITDKTTPIPEAKEFMIAAMENGLTPELFEETYNYLEGRVKYHLNPDYDPRAEILGDNPEKNDNPYYGNNDVEGPDAEHGTHVAGIIAAVRGNNLGLNGVANDVKIMPIRTVPDGDEYDKDVANAIRYAVDNGAQIINMSFGKAYSPQKHFVDEAILYAQNKGVLLVNGAGNDAEDLDRVMSYPTNVINGSRYPKGWMTVGASTMYNDAALVGDFSNFGRRSVDIFAPGVDIYSTVPDDKYKALSGTSMASPVVAGVAALIMSYYPQLTADEVKEAILESATNRKRLKVYIPDEMNPQSKKIRFKKLSSTGGVINVYEAVQEAEKMAAKKN